MKIVIIGNGMYVSGWGTDTFGTILPAVLEYKRGGGEIVEVYMDGTNRKHSLAAAAKANELMSQAGVSVKLNVYPENVENDFDAYKNVLNSIKGSACALVSTSIVEAANISINKNSSWVSIKL